MPGNRPLEVEYGAPLRVSVLLGGVCGGSARAADAWPPLRRRRRHRPRLLSAAEEDAVRRTQEVECGPMTALATVRGSEQAKGT
jgi:hypothetical protein